MKTNESLDRAMDVEARLREMVGEMDNWPKSTKTPPYIEYRPADILVNAQLARGEAKRREEKRMRLLGIDKR
jgi:hypothetical protein